MKAYVVERYAKDGVRSGEVPEPGLGAGDVLVRVSAAGVNPLDNMIRNGEFKRLVKYRKPFVLGHDMSGVVTGVGPAVRDFVGNTMLTTLHRKGLPIQRRCTA